MRQCPQCGGETAASLDACGVCGAPIDGDMVAERAAAVADLASPFHPKPPQAPVGMPRRFSIGTLMILTTLFAVLFGVLKVFRVPSEWFAAISIFIGGIVVCQALLFKGRKPRLASFVGGIFMFFSIAVVLTLVHYFTAPGRVNIIELIGGLIGVSISTMFVGGPLGYAVGCVAAAVFLVRKEPDDGEPLPEEPSVTYEDRREPATLELQPPLTLPRTLSVTKLEEAWHEAGEPGDETTRPSAGSPDGSYVHAVVVDEAELAGRVPVTPLATDTTWGAPFGLKPSRPAVCVPRRFSVGTMMILVTALAVLLGVLKSFGVEPVVFATVAAFLGGVGVCQVLMFKGTDPRRASFFGGMITAGVLVVIIAVVGGSLMQNMEFVVEWVFVGGVVAFILGGPLGYAAGCLVAAIFLVRKEPDDEPVPDDGC